MPPQTTNPESLTDSDIAIIGLGCRFPGEATGPQQFWDFLCKGRSAYTFASKRWNVDAFHHPVKGRLGTSVTPGGHFLAQDLASFDAAFFNIGQNEASSMDPQQRLTLEVSYEAFEDAGIPIDRLSGSNTGCYIGGFTTDWRETMTRDAETAPMYAGTGVGIEFLSNRVSWFFDLRGPSLTLNTACSSSLVAFHLACQSLRNGECGMALAGGVSLHLNPDFFLFLSNQGFLAKDGRSKSFDAAGDGYGRGEGCGIVVLKRVKDAIKDGDSIRAIVRATGVNQDGKTKSITLPNAVAQAELIRPTYRSANLEMRETQYFEAHGTGTQAGDPTELEAVSLTIGSALPADKKILVGSVKPNIGHAEASAGIAGVIKGVLALEQGVIPPNILFNTPNPKIQFEKWKIEVPTTLIPWPGQDVRRMSVNSFGAGGTNAHAVLEGAEHYLRAKGHHSASLPDQLPVPIKTLVSSNLRLFVINAYDHDGLARQREALARFIQSQLPRIPRPKQDAYLQSLAYTLSERRSALPWKSYVVAADLGELAQELQALPPPSGRSSESPRLGFIFTGQGAQWARMGVELRQYDVFQSCLEQAETFFKEELGCSWSVIEELERAEGGSRISDPEYSQALCTVLQVAIVDLLSSWGVAPSAVAGHSSGEIAAAYCLGALSREDAWTVAYYRGLLSSRISEIRPSLHGSMIAVGLSEKQAEEYIARVSSGKIVVACVNSPSSVTVSGDTAGIEELQQLLRQDSVFERRLKVGVAYHSSHMQTIAHLYLDAISGIETGGEQPDRKMYSTVTGDLVIAHELGPLYWVENLTSPVRFSDAVRSLVLQLNSSGQQEKKPAVDVLVEIGPHSALGGPIKQILQDLGVKNVGYKSVLSRGKSAAQTTLQCVGDLLVQGVPVSIKRVNNYNAQPFAMAPLHDLPSYACNHSRMFWAEPRLNREYRMRPHPRYSLLGAPMPSLSENERVWRGVIRAAEEPWVLDHRIQNLILYPAAGYIAMAIEGARQLADTSREISEFRLRDVQIGAAATIAEDADLEIMLQIRPHAHGTRDKAFAWFEFVINTCAPGQEVRQNCSGLLRIHYHHQPSISSADGLELSMKDTDNTVLSSALERYMDIQRSCTVQENPAKFYEELNSLGLNYGPTFSNMTEIHLGKGMSCCTVEVGDHGSTIIPPASTNSRRPYIIHPTVLDTMFHSVFAALKLPGPGGILKGAMVPKSIDEITIAADIDIAEKALFKGFAVTSKHGLREIMSDVHMFDDTLGKQAVTIVGFCCADVAGALDTTGSPIDTTADEARLCTTTVWLPAIELLLSEQLRDFVEDLATSAFNSSPSDHSSSAAPGLEMSQFKIQEVLKLIAQIKPGSSVLELGAEPGPLSGMSAHSLSFLDYTVAGKDESLLKQFRQNFQTSGIQPRFILFDSEKSIESQGIAAGMFDIVVCSVMVDTENVEIIFKQVSRLLKPGGKVCLLERPRMDGRVNASQLRMEGQWEALLSKQGLQAEFTSICEQTGLTVASLPLDIQGQEAVVDGVIILERLHGSAASQAVAAEIAEHLQAASIAAKRVILDEEGLVDLKGKMCISLLELETSLVESLSPTEFGSLKRILLEASSLVWFVGFDGPAAALITGLARSVRNETPGLRLRTLLGPVDCFASHKALASAVVKVSTSPTIHDDEFLVRKGGLLLVSRLVEDDELSRAISGVQHGEKVFSPLSQAIRAQKLAVQNPGMLDSLCFEVDASLEGDIADDEIEIEVRASGVNFRDVMTAMGQIPDKTIGREASGIVRQVGKNVTRFEVGDRVCCLAHAAHKPLLRVPVVQCQPIPKGLSFEVAATLPLVHYTAYHALVNLARVRKGQSILIHAAAGGVGQATIQLAQHFKLDIFATVGSDAKRELIKDLYGVQDDHIFSSRDPSFVNGLMKMTKGRGVDCVLNSLSGEMLRQTWYCLAPFGVFVEIGLKDIIGNTGLDMLPFKKHATFCAFNLEDIAKINPQLIGEIGEGVFELLRDGVLRPVSPVTVYAVSQVESAFRLMQAGKHHGKLVLSYSPKDVVPMLRRSDDVLKLDPNATYILVGGFGGLGRSLIRMLAASGAHHLAVLSRSGASSEAAQACVNEVERQYSSTRVHVYQCDVADEKAVRRVIDDITNNLPSIKGAIQAAMVLRDVLFEQMSYQQWIESTRPKVQGSWNLHQYLPKDLDFFVILSSFAGVFGNRGQSNYAAAGAYEDALAHHRRAQGLKAVTIDLGIMRDSGVIAEGTTATTNLKDLLSFGISDTTFHALIKKVIVDELASSGSSTLALRPQIITGLPTGQAARKAGIDTLYFFDDPRFSILSRSGLQRDDAGPSEAGLGVTTSVSLSTRLSRATSRDEAVSLVQEALVNRLAKFLQTSPGEIDTGKPLYHYGVDSLAAVEMRNWLFREIKAEVSLLEVMAATPIVVIAGDIAARSKLVPAGLASVKIRGF